MEKYVCPTCVWKCDIGREKEMNLSDYLGEKLLIVGGSMVNFPD